ncbi:MAG: AMP-binding protein [Nitrososphaerota archaeon]|jgi:acyl-CoA synthetase (AMP-forming)/AMP-acid ligase II|nr:AMP-binding protein [Nitrososphaerota archaeon]
MPITEILAKNARLYGSAICLTEINPGVEEKRGLSWKELSLVEPRQSCCYRKELTWRAFDERANQFAHLLLERGVKRGDKVGILLMNCIEWLPIYFGVLRSGAIVVPLNFRYSAEEIKYALELADVSILIFGPEFTERLQVIKDNVPGVHSMFYVGSDCPGFAEGYEDLAGSRPRYAPEIELFDRDDAAIYFSSGTTGFPKAILHSHQTLVRACEVEQNHHSQTHEDIFLCIPPLYHTGAKMHWFGSFLVGGSAVLLRGIKPKWIIETAANERASIVWLLVPWAQDILDAIESGEINLSDYDLSAWRLMHIGAQPVPPSLIRRWKKVFPTHDYDTNYGLSESSGPGAVHLGVENIHKVGSIGKAGYSWQTRIVNEQGEPVKPGEVGELILFGSSVMKGYYKDPEATAATIKAGWLYTGDMACEDEEGFIFLVDRKKDVIITGGENIYPVQIEDFLRGYDKIKDVAVIGIADHRLGEIALAIIEIKPGLECGEEEIQKFCTQLPRYKRPYRIIFDQVPRNATGKIEKPRLRRKYCGESVVRQQFELDSINPKQAP